MTVTHDVVGHETLDRIGDSLRAYNALMYEHVAPHVHGSVLEIGSGIGNLSEFLIRTERVLLTDVSEDYLSILSSRFGDNQAVGIARWDIGEDPPADVAAASFDTVICLNVLEHVEGDLQALVRIRSLVSPGGHLVLLVPAHQFLYNELDRALGHYRRYNARSVSAVLQSAGFQVLRTWYFNMLGTIGWYFNGTILRRKLLPAGQLKAFDWIVPVLRLETRVSLPFGLSVIAVATPA